MSSAHIHVDITGSLGTFDYAYHLESTSAITTVFGISGAGKSTLIKALSGEVTPENGTIAVADSVFFDREKGLDLRVEARRVGHIFQDGRLFPHLTVRQNLTYARWAGFRKSPLSFDDVVALLGIGGLLKRYPMTLSGGEKRRVAIGRALLSDPRILLADEPLSGLDFARRAEVLPYLKSLSRETGIPMIYVSHDLSEIIELGGTLVLLEDGHVRQTGPVAAVLPLITEREGGVNAAPRSLLIATHAGYVAQDVATAVMVGSARILVPEKLDPSLDAFSLIVGAEDVALARKIPLETSFQNVLPVRVLSQSETAGGQVDITLDLSGQKLVSRITARACADLNLKPGDSIYALIKSVALAHTYASSI